MRNFGLSLSPVTKFQKKQKAFLLGILFFLQKSMAFSNKRRNNEDQPFQSYSDKLACLKRSHIALWDVSFGIKLLKQLMSHQKHLENFAVSEKMLNFAAGFIHHLTEGNQRTLGQDALRPLLFLIRHKKRVPTKACHRN